MYELYAILCVLCMCNVYTIINKSKANYRATVRQTTEKKNTHIHRKSVLAVDERERKRLNGCMCVCTMSWAFALFYTGCFFESMPFIDPTHRKTDGNCIFTILWTLLNWTELDLTGLDYVLYCTTNILQLFLFQHIMFFSVRFYPEDELVNCGRKHKT